MQTLQNLNCDRGDAPQSWRLWMDLAGLINISSTYLLLLGTYLGRDLASWAFGCSFFFLDVVFNQRQASNSVSSSSHTNPGSCTCDLRVHDLTLQLSETEGPRYGSREGGVQNYDCTLHRTHYAAQSQYPRP